MSSQRISKPNGKLPKGIPTIKQVGRMVVNAIESSRRAILKTLFDERRDLNDECGYPATESLNAKSYQDLFDREPIANRAVEVLPKESWQVQPEIVEVAESDESTAFEQAWDGLSRNLRGPKKSFYQDEEGSPIWEYLLRADILSGIGHFGVILLGINDGKELREPADLSLNGNPQKLLYMRVFPESLIQITQLETDPNNPRFNQPIKYTLTFNDPNINAQGSVIGMTTATKEVHWTRVVHIADNLESSEIFGTPRMRPVLNPLLDIRKVRASSGEMYYKGAFMGLSIETHPQLGGDVDIDEEATKDVMEDYQNGLQRYIQSIGQTVKTLAPTVVDPTPHVRIHIEAVCIKLGIPIRIFMGSERGELASSQDDAAWNDRMKARQRNYITPRIIVPVVDRLIWLRVLPVPKGYSVKWPDLTSQSDTERATIAAQRTAAIASYVQSGAMQLIQPLDFLSRILYLSDEEAQAILETSQQELDHGTESSGSPLLGLVGGISAMIELFKMAQEGGLTEEQLKQQIMLFFKVDEQKAQALIAEGLATPSPQPTEGEPVEGQLPGIPQPSLNTETLANVVVNWMMGCVKDRIVKADSLLRKAGENSQGRNINAS